MVHTIPVERSRFEVSKILCVVRNYVEHAKEMASEVPSEPIFFLKPPTALLPNGGEVLLPPESAWVEVETELAVILGRGGWAIPRARAMDLVAGYAVFFDITARDLQAKAKKEGRPWTASKGFDTFAPISAAAPAPEVKNPHNLGIRLRVNGTLRQDSSTCRMVFKIPELLAAASRVMTLEAGDILATGTPAGVWPIVPGDVLEAEISEVGSLRCTVATRKP